MAGSEFALGWLRWACSPPAVWPCSPCAGWWRRRLAIFDASSTCVDDLEGGERALLTFWMEYLDRYEASRARDRRIARVFGGLLAPRTSPYIRLCGSIVVRNFDRRSRCVRSSELHVGQTSRSPWLSCRSFMLAEPCCRGRGVDVLRGEHPDPHGRPRPGLPSDVVGAAPTRPCSTPGQNGRIQGECATGPAPTDGRLPDRILLLVAGLAVLAVGLTVDRQRRMSRQHDARRTVAQSTHASSPTR